MVSQENIVEELAAIAFARATDVLSVEGGVLTVKDWDALREQDKAAIASVEKTSSGLKVKFYDKMKALELLGKAMGLFDGGALESQDCNLLEAIMAATGKEVDTDDLWEIQQAAASGVDMVESAQMEEP